MSYVLYDSRGYVADVASNRGMATIRSALARVDVLKPLAEEGAIDMKPEVRAALNSVKGDESVQNFVRNARRCHDVCIISDGTDDDDEGEDDEEAEKGGPGSGHHGHAGIPGHRGGSAPTTGTATAKRNRLARAAKMREFGDQYATAPVEHGLIMTDDATTVFEVVGERDKINFSDRQISQIEDSSRDKPVLVHNHPNGSSLSDADVSFAAQHGMSEVVAVSKDHICRARIIDRNKCSDYWELNSAWQATKRSLMDKYVGMIESGEMTAGDAWVEHSHEVNAIVAESHGFEYTRTAR